MSLETTVVIILLSINIVNGFNYQIRCLFFNNSCVPYCPRLMFPYHTRCDRDTISQRTCDDPIVYTIGFTCGWSRCDCNGDLFLDENIMQCVEKDECTTYHRTSRRKSGGGRKRRVKSKKIRIPAAERDLIDMK